MHLLVDTAKVCRGRIELRKLLPLHNKAVAEEVEKLASHRERFNSANAFDVHDLNALDSEESRDVPASVSNGA